MALDLSGFTIPEQKFEGLYKLGEQLAEKRKAEDAAKLAQQKLDAEKQKAQSEDLKGFLADLQKMTDPKDYYSNRVVNKLSGAYSELSNAAKSGASTNELRMRAVPLVNNIVKESEITKTISSKIDKDLESYPKEYYNIPQLKNEVYSAVFKNPDGTDKSIEEVDYSPSALNEIIQNKGYGIVNSSSILKDVKDTPSQTVSVKKTYRDKSGKESTSFIETQMKPWEIYDEKTNQIVPFSIIAMDEGKPILHKGKPVNIVPDEVYNDFINKNIANRDYLDSQAKLHINEYDKQVAPTAGVAPESSKIDINSPQANLIKKAVLYDFLYQNKTGGVKREIETKYKMPTEGRGAGGAGDATGGGQTTGNVLDEIGISQILDTKSGARVENGSVTTQDGKPYNGRIYIEKKYFPANLISVMKTGGIELSDDDEGAEFDVKDGIIQNIRTNKGIADRNTMFNYQEKWNTESKNAPQPTFGAKAVDAAKNVYKKVKTAVTPTKKTGIKGTSKSIFGQ
jgi:hypothetical protein